MDSLLATSGRTMKEYLLHLLIKPFHKRLSCILVNKESQLFLAKNLSLQNHLPLLSFPSTSDSSNSLLQFLLRRDIFQHACFRCHSAPMGTNPLALQSYGFHSLYALHLCVSSYSYCPFPIHTAAEVGRHVSSGMTFRDILVWWNAVMRAC